MIANSGGVEPLVNLLDSELEDVLVNAVNAIRVLCSGHNENQTAAAMSGALEPLVEFLTVASGWYSVFCSERLTRFLIVPAKGTFQVTQHCFICFPLPSPVLKGYEV